MSNDFIDQVNPNHSSAKDAEDNNQSDETNSSITQPKFVIHIEDFISQLDHRIASEDRQCYRELLSSFNSSYNLQTRS